MKTFNMSQELATLTISLFIFGYCVGPLFWGPLSEQVSIVVHAHDESDTASPLQYGRRPVFLVSFPVYMVRV